MDLWRFQKIHSPQIVTEKNSQNLSFNKRRDCQEKTLAWACKMAHGSY